MAEQHPEASSHRERVEELLDQVGNLMVQKVHEHPSASDLPASEALPASEQQEARSDIKSEETKAPEASKPEKEEERPEPVEGFPQEGPRTEISSEGERQKQLGDKKSFTRRLKSTWHWIRNQVIPQSQSRTEEHVASKADEQVLRDEPESASAGVQARKLD
jgi:hypothetical protein